MKYDVAIIGGGIHGVGVAQAAAAAGYSVVLIEKAELAHGTSSRSSKLIHGGLRYLEGGHVNLVRECLYERQLLVKNAPDLVKLVPFHIPAYKETSRRPLELRAGLTIYGALTGFHKSARFHVVPRREWGSLDGIKMEGLQKVFRYFDAQTDDILLTRAVMDSARELGAELMEHTELSGASRDGKGWRLNIVHKGEEKDLQAGVLVNASGPWINLILERIEGAHRPRPVDLVQGSHIVLDNKVEKGIYYIEAPEDRRAVFVMPWYDKMLVGTTEKEFHGDPELTNPTSEEVDYLLATLTHYFPSFEGTTAADVVDSFAGLRVLPQAEGRAFSRPRETILMCDDDSAPSLLSIYGGKLTAYRATAEKVIKKLKWSLPERKAAADTHKIKLHRPL
ncbi:MAG: FAD-dependent oxidoreductase [bacterium]|nr:FAD-dependent oxidoreductase [bacterium]